MLHSNRSQVGKDAAFMRLAEDRFYNDYPCIIMTAKGQVPHGSHAWAGRAERAGFALTTGDC